MSADLSGGAAAVPLAHVHGSQAVIGAVEDVLRLLDETDPEGFHAAGGPADKYASAAIGLAGAARSGGLDGDRLLTMWTFWFGSRTRVADWDRQSRDDLAAMLRHVSQFPSRRLPQPRSA